MSINGLYRLAAAVPPLKLGNPTANADAILELYERACGDKVSAVVFPRLCLTGFSCGDALSSPVILEAATASLRQLCQATAEYDTAMIVSLPLLRTNRLFEATALLHNGKIAGFSLNSLDRSSHTPSQLEFDGQLIPCAPVQCYSTDDFTFAVAAGPLFDRPGSPADQLALAGVQAILNPVAIPALDQSYAELRQDVQAASRRLHAACLTVSAGTGESTDSWVFGGRAFLAISGKITASAPGLVNSPQYITSDFFPRWLDRERLLSGEFTGNDVASVPLSPLCQPDNLERLALPRLPFLPDEPDERRQRCREILETQALALAGRVERSRSKRLVLGVSGGLDSTLALLVCRRCSEILGKTPDFVLALTMPGMGTSGRTRSNAGILAEELGAELREISIASAVRQHFADIGHDPANLNVVYENSQARERTQILMDVANAENGLVVGTGDMSEIALGWCTFNGDHMAMYGVNANVTKSAIRIIIEEIAADSPERLAKCLRDIIDTPVSPELLPGQQHTEAIIGNYDLHDFFLYYFLKYAESPDNLLALACQAFRGTYSPEQIAAILKLFLRRFLTQQFKRNVMPDAPAVSELSLSPKNGWNAPSDLELAPWLRS